MNVLNIGKKRWVACRLVCAGLTFGLEKYQSQDGIYFQEATRAEFLQFDFGSNWERYIHDIFLERPLSRVGIAERLESIAGHLKHEFGLESFEGRTFLDVGCGSGIASFAALWLNATRVVSIDFQPTAVAATRRLKDLVKATPSLHFTSTLKGRTWDIYQGSILDSSFLKSLAPADLVYSYGVMMHTGNAWLALSNLARLVNTDRGLLLVFLNTSEKMDKKEQELWSAFKKEYNSMASWEQEESVFAYSVGELFQSIRMCLDWPRTPDHSRFERFATLRGCLQRDISNFALISRGMDFMTDARDWLGGYPYEWLASDKIIHFFQHDVRPAMKTLRVSNGGLGGFLLTPKATGEQYFSRDVMPLNGWSWSQYSWLQLHPNEFIPWQDFLKGTATFNTEASGFRYLFNLVKGELCYLYMFPAEEWARCATHSEDCISPNSLLLQDMDILGWGDDSKDGMFCKLEGSARYRVASSFLLLSTADGSHPGHNGHTYQLLTARTNVLLS